jgi:hypothetical protein
MRESRRPKSRCPLATGRCQPVRSGSLERGSKGYMAGPTYPRFLLVSDLGIHGIHGIPSARCSGRPRLYREAVRQRCRMSVLGRDATGNSIRPRL